MFVGVKVRSVRKSDNLTAICEPIVYKMWEPLRLTTLWASTASYRDIFTFLFSFTPPLPLCHGQRKIVLHIVANLFIRLYCDKRKLSKFTSSLHMQ
jgi:hypothetical protein